MMNEQTPTPASAWNRGVLLKLPGSGFVVRIRPLDMTQVMREEGLNNPFLTAMHPMIVAMTGEQPKETEDKRHPIVQLRDLYERVAMLAVVEPRVVAANADPDKNEVNVADWQFEDLQFVYATLGRPLNELERFSQDAGAYMEFVQDIIAVPSTSESDVQPEVRN